MKRCLDLAIVLPLLVVTAPVFAVIAAAIRLTSPGPIFFRQVRIGLRGRSFSIYKFRTMRVGPETSHHHYIRQWIHAGERARQSDGTFKINHDPRITSVGRWLRRFSLDELPQLLNVLRGEMSLVGPRPALPYEVAEYELHQLCRLRTLPGLTGLWQVSGRNRLSFTQMIELDIAYMHRWTLPRDLHILLRTIPAVLGATGH